MSKRCLYQTSVDPVQLQSYLGCALAMTEGVSQFIRLHFRQGRWIRNSNPA